MTQATRCPSCGTTFRLHAAQLAAAQGWVRCSRCADVFLAQDTLISLGGEQETPPAREAQAQALSSGTADARASGVSTLAVPVSLSDAEPASTDAMAHAAALGSQNPEVRGAGRDGPRETLVAPVDALPRFVWESERLAARPMSALQRVLWGGLLVLGLAGLLLQGTYMWRSELAARWPATQPALSKGCELLGCTLQPLRRLAWLRVESSELRQVDGTLYQLQVLVRNAGPQALQWPAVDLSLTDASAQVMARRALMPQELAATGPSLGSGQEATLRARLSTGERAVSGFTIELFYP